MPQHNYLDLPRIDIQRGAVQTNAMNQQFSREDRALAKDARTEQERIKNTEWMAAIGRWGVDQMSQDPNSYVKFMPMVEQEGQRRGVWDKIGIDYTTASPQEILKGFQAMEQQGMVALGETQQTEYGKQTSGLDPESGEPAFGRMNLETGQFERAGGLIPSSRTGFTSGAQTFFEDVISDFTPEEQEMARRVQAGIVARAGTVSAPERIAVDEELTESVAESQATIAQATQFGKATGASRAKIIDKGFKTIESIAVNIRNLDKATAAIDEGASTGAIESRFFPTIRKSTVLLEQIQAELGLDVVGGVTFGALSKGELDLALTVALPVGLQPPELRQWLQDKKSAQQKLSAYYMDQIDFLDKGGTVAGFLREQQRGMRASGLNSGGAGPPTATGPNGEKLVLQNGQWVQQ